MDHYHKIPEDRIRFCTKESCYIQTQNFGLEWNDIDVKREDLEKLFSDKFKELAELGVPFSEFSKNLVGVVLQYEWAKSLAPKD